MAQQVGPAMLTKKDTTVAALTDTMTAQQGKTAHTVRKTPDARAGCQHTVVSVHSGQV